MEKNQVFTLTLVIVLAVFLGIIIVVKGSPSPLQSEMLKNQADTLRIIKSLEQKAAGGGGESLGAVLESLQDLQKRVAVLEAMAGVGAGPGGRGGLVQQGQRPPPPPQEDFTKVHTIEKAHSPIRGNAKAPITIVEFVDFQCPFCSRFHPLVNQVMEEYPGKVKYMLKNFPLSFHPEARPAAKAAFAAGEQGKYWEMVELLLADNSSLSKDKYTELAKQLKLNVDKFKKDMEGKDGQWEEWIKADMDLGMQVDVRGTPTFYLNGRKTLARDLPTFKKEIDGILKKK